PPLRESPCTADAIFFQRLEQLRLEPQRSRRCSGIHLQRRHLRLLRQSQGLAQGQRHVVLLARREVGERQPQRRQGRQEVLRTIADQHLVDAQQKVTLTLHLLARQGKQPRQEVAQVVGIEEQL